MTDPLVQDALPGFVKFLAVHYNNGQPDPFNFTWVGLQDGKPSTQEFDPPDSQEYYLDDGNGSELDAPLTQPFELRFEDRPTAGRGAYRDGEAAAFETTLVGVAADGSCRT